MSNESPLESFLSWNLEVATSILILTNLRDIASLRSASKFLKAIVDDERIWRLLFKRDFKASKFFFDVYDDPKFSYRLRYFLNVFVRRKRFLTEFEDKFTREILFDDQVIYLCEDTNPIVRWDALILDARRCVMQEEGIPESSPVFRLDLSNSELPRLPICESLRVLDLTFAKLSCGLPILPNLTKLTIRHSNIQTIPFQLTKLEVLEARGTELRDVPKELENLRVLDLDSCRFVREIPSTLEKLWWLNIRSGNIHDLPETLTNLRYLNIVDSRISYPSFPLNKLRQLVVTQQQYDNDPVIFSIRQNFGEKIVQITGKPIKF